MNRKIICFISAWLLPGLALAQNAVLCEALLNYSVPGSDIEISTAHWAENRSVRTGPFGPETQLPPHCHVEGSFDRRIGVNDVAYALRFAINLPAQWNGRYMFQGGGGLNGILNEPLGSQAVGNRIALGRGFAVVSTDSGHQAQGGFDPTFFSDQEAVLNFQLLGNARVTDATKPVVEAYYGNAIDRAYFVGCSTGGREGMIMAQRYPMKFDGIVSGAPAMRTSMSNIGIRWVGVQLNQAAPRDAQGNPVPGPLLNAAERELLVDSLVAECDTLDGAADGLLFNPRACDFDPRDIACAGGESGANCLAFAKAEAVHAAMQGPMDSRSVQVYPGFQYDPGIDDGMGLPGILNSTNNPPEGPGSTGVLAFDVDTAVREATRPDLIMGESTSVMVSSFVDNGGKHIFYHGAADPWFSVNETIRYYEEMAAFNGGLETVKDWSRLFHVPGMAHCAGGERTLDSFDMLAAIVDWVENDNAPEQVVATGTSVPGVSRPLCAWPTYAHYAGSGDSEAAANYRCRSPE